MAYIHDVFVSYRHHGAVFQWVHNHFYPRLREWLEASAPTEVSVFIDTTNEAGAVWPQALQNALAGSRLMVAVYSAEYFRSPWCLAEFQTMLQRQVACEIPNKDDARGLIIPVKFNDGEYFSAEACEITYRDLSAWSYPYPVFSESRKYLSFADAVRELAELIVPRLPTVPDWSSEWPIADPVEPQKEDALPFPHL